MTRITRLYYNTGLRVGETLDYTSKLNNAPHLDLEQHWDYQDYFLTSLDIMATYEQVKNADILQYGQGYYYITGVSMINENNARLNLQLSGVLTMGGACAIEYDNGLLKRAHPIKDDDFSNLLPEPVSSQEPLKCVSKKRVGADSINGQQIFMSTLSLDQEIKVDEHGNVEPLHGTATALPVVGDEFEDHIIIPNAPKTDPGTTINGMSQKGVSYYVQRKVKSDKSNDIGNQIAYLRSLGLENSVIGSYMVPMGYIKGTYPAGTKNYIPTLAKTVQQSYDGDAWKGGKNVRFKKTLTICNTYTLLSKLSGDIRTYKATDICKAPNSVLSAPKFLLEADTNYKGKPYIWPKYFDGADNTTEINVNGITGMEWQDIPVVVGGVSGSLWMRNAYNQNVAQIGENTINMGYNSVSSVLSNITPAKSGKVVDVVDADLQTTFDGYQGGNANVGGIIDTAGRTILAGRQFNLSAAKIDTDYDKASTFATPNINGTPATGLQTCVANNFVLYHHMLSDNDIKRIDKFFTKYGYAQNCVFDKAFLNVDVDGACYVQTSGIKIKRTGRAAEVGLAIKELTENELNGGLRVWHRLPN